MCWEHCSPIKQTHNGSIFADKPGQPENMGNRLWGAFDRSMNFDWHIKVNRRSMVYNSTSANFIVPNKRKIVE